LANYYYAGASLPLLRLDEKPAIREEEFISIVKTGLSEKHATQILSLNLKESINVENLASLGLEYWRREKNIRNELVKLRSAAMGSDGTSFLVDDENDPFVTDGAVAAFKAQSPLEAEIILDNIRWGWMDELQSGHFFDQDFFMAYYVKLQILLRKEDFEVEQGKKNFQDVYESVLDAKNEDQTGVTQ